MSLKENEIHAGDAIKLMAEIPDGSIDMILCDLPSGRTRCKWDTVIPMLPLWEHYKRIIKRRGAIVLLAIQPFATDLINAAGRKWFRYDLIWHKPNPTGFLNANRMPLRSHEHILLFYSRLPVYNPQMMPGKPYSKLRRGEPNHYEKTPRSATVSDGARYPGSVITVSNNNTGREIHASQKPLPLFEHLIRTYSTQGDLVLDNAMGSGTTAVAALRCDRRFVGIEIDEEFVAGARRRIREFHEFGNRDPRQLIFGPEIMENGKTNANRQRVSGRGSAAGRRRV